MPIALVTGSGSGLGKSIALALSRSGFDLLLHAHNSLQGLAQTKKEIEELGRSARSIVANLSTKEGQDHLVGEVVAATPAIDLVVHNASVFEERAFASVTREQFRMTMGLHVEAPFFISQALMPVLHKTPDPQIITIIDAMHDRAYLHHADYYVGKSAQAAITRILAQELAPKIRVNAVAPGALTFPTEYDAAKRKRIVDKIPLKRHGNYDDVNRAINYLVSASYVTGQILNVDGGRSGVA